jgi:hypothetical protein
MLKQYLSNKSKRFHQLTVLLVVIVVAGAGTLLLLGSHAATPYASVSANSGTVSGGAISQTCSGASSGSCVVFGQSSDSDTQANCFAHPGACGYPDPAYNNVGAGNCSSLTQFNWSDIGATFPAGSYYYSGSGNQIELNASNITISNVDLGNMVIYMEPGSNNFTMNHDCMETNGNDSSGSFSVIVPSGISGLTIEHSSIGGANTTNQAIGTAIDDFGTNSTEEYNYFYNESGGSNEYQGSGTIANNYEETNVVTLASVVNGVQEYAHVEDIECSDGTYNITHNTLFNNQDQTAVIFCDTHNGQGGACDNHLTVSDNFMVGGDYTIQPCGNATSIGTSTISITDNRFARCLGSTTDGSDGTTICSGLTVGTSDGHGYYPNDGSYGPASQFYTGTGWTWSGNYWDDNLQPVNE